MNVLDRCSLRATTDDGRASSRQSHVMWESSTTQANLDNDQCPDTRATGMDCLMSRGSVWKLRYVGQDHCRMCSCFCLFFISSLDLGPVQLASVWVFIIIGVSQVEVDFPRPSYPTKVCPAWYKSVAGTMSLYKYVPGMMFSLCALHFFSTLVRGYEAQEVCT